MRKIKENKPWELTTVSIFLLWSGIWTKFQQGSFNKIRLLYCFYIWSTFPEVLYSVITVESLLGEEINTFKMTGFENQREVVIAPSYLYSRNVFNQILYSILDSAYVWKDT